MQINRSLQDRKSPGMHTNRMCRCLSVKAPDIASCLVEAHQVMGLCHRAECGLDGGLHIGSTGTGDGDLHEGAEQRSRPANAI